MDLQDAANWTIPEGEVKNLHDKDNRLLWSAVGYDVKYNGDTTQQTYTGKNLCYDVEITGNGAIIKYYFNKPASKNIVWSSDLSDSTASNGVALVVDGANLGVLFTVSGEAGQRVSRNVPLTDAQYVSILEGTSILLQLYKSGGNFTLPSEPQIEVGTTATAYEPYVGGVPSPNPDYPQDVNVVTGSQTIGLTGKNLFDISKVISNWNTTTNVGVKNNNDGTLTISTPSTSSTVAAVSPNKLSDYCPALQVGDTVTLSFNTTGTNNYIYLYGTGANILWGTNASSRTKTITQPMLDAQVLWYASGVSTTATISNFQLEKGDSVTSYEPYQGSTYTVNLGTTELCKIGNYQDYIYKSGNDWYVHKETGKALFKGTEDWDTSTIRDNVMYYYSNSGLPVSGGAYNIVPSYSNYFTPDSYADALSQGSTADNCFFFHDNSHYVAFKYNAMSSLTDWTTWLSTHHTTVYYQLNTPTDTQITDSTLISQLDAIHNWLTRYDYYEVVSGNLPIIIDRTGII